MLATSLFFASTSFWDGYHLYVPGAGFSHRFDPKLQMVAGLPYSSVDWKPLEHVDVKGEYNLFSDLRLSVGYEFIPHWTVYGTYGYVRELFRVDGLPERKHLLFYQRRAEIGVRFTPAELLRWLEDTQLRNERARRSHVRRRALRSLEA